MGSTTVPQSFDNMTNLKLLCVLLVLVAVCGEADSKMRYKTMCGSFVMPLNCRKGHHITYTKLEFGWRHWLLWWRPIYRTWRKHKCLNYARPVYQKMCDGKQKCVINSNHIPHYYRQCAYKYSCLIVKYNCIWGNWLMHHDEDPGGTFSTSWFPMGTSSVPCGC